MTPLSPPRILSCGWWWRVVRSHGKQPGEGVGGNRRFIQRFVP